MIQIQKKETPNMSVSTFRGRCSYCCIDNEKTQNETQFCPKMKNSICCSELAAWLSKTAGGGGSQRPFSQCNVFENIRFGRGWLSYVPKDILSFIFFVFSEIIVQVRLWLAKAGPGTRRWEPNIWYRKTHHSAPNV